MKVVLLGTGNIAHFFAQQLSSHPDINIVQLYNRTLESGLVLSQAYGIPIVQQIEAIDTTADVYIFCVKDSAIAALADALPLKGKLAVHCAGSQPLSILEGCSEQNAVIWPVYSINKHNLPQHRDVPLIVEGNQEAALQKALYLAERLSDRSTAVNYQQRQYMHLNAVIANNFTNHLLAICTKISAEQQVPFNFLLPIITQTLQQVEQHPPEQLQTGPAIRKDIPTMEAHIRLLKDHPEWAAVYESISASILKMYS
ncbi:hypothetical protein DBR32_10050 [Taibaiella sp. KBW10]|uniref:Rossmann-like and DUF2520 domain-containing protein n=1 Tax=Taibaiella sp. KBW10 TaxID=2153357 RepID=UPI000F5B0920|nr:Rossmann-like and DUF2520 domain-containing protein [Taibaiella sp. KBW10]RQO31040.1 hypothetical protein DBR32_10050 [Taibaiella sp. KBW10]